ncbi:histidine phosphatase family protein [Candidatus Falkowbacteria bacterium]|nr:histidine phosphatase family protein [Candidatus Falkowbacteria bacterium]
MERLKEIASDDGKKEEGLKVSVVRHGTSTYRQPEWTDIATADDINAIGRYDDGEKTPEEIAAGKEKAIQKIRETAKRIAADIGPDEEVVIWSSPTGRTLETARIISEVLQEEGINIKKKGPDKDYGVKVFERLGEVKNFKWELFEPLMKGGEVKFGGQKFVIDKKLSNPNNLGYPDYFTTDAIKNISERAKSQWPKEYVKEIESFESFAHVSERMAETLRRLKKLGDKKYRLIIVSHDAMVGNIVKTFTHDQFSGIEPGELISLERKEGKLVVRQVGDLTEGDREADIAPNRT